MHKNYNTIFSEYMYKSNFLNGVADEKCCGFKRSMALSEMKRMCARTYPMRNPSLNSGSILYDKAMESATHLTNCVSKPAGL